ncbi:MAG: HEAT repeat domain-containing protein [Planctomycetota bacterium]
MRTPKLLSGLAWMMLFAAFADTAWAQDATPPESLRPATTDKPIGALATLLLDNRAGSVSEEAMPERLKQVAATSLDECFQALKSGHFDVRTADGKRTGRPLQGFEFSMVLDTFAHKPLPELRRFLAEQGSHGIDEACCQATLLVLGRYGTQSDVPSVLTWVSETAHGKRPSTAMRGAFEKSLGQILQNDPQALRALPQLYGAAPQALLPGIVQATAQCAQPESVPTLLSLLRLVPRMDEWILTEVGHCADSLRGPIPETARDQLHQTLLHATDAARIAAIRTTAKLRNSRSIPYLIELLASGEPNIRSQALEALQEIARLPLPADVGRWRTWYQGEQQWLQAESARQLHLAANSTEAGVQALLEVSTHHIFGEELAPKVQPLLESMTPEKQAIACAVLGHLGSLSSTPELLKRLDPSQPKSVRKAAFDALHRLTQSNHGDDPAQWRQAGW